MDTTYVYWNTYIYTSKIELNLVTRENKKHILTQKQKTKTKQKIPTTKKLTINNS